MKALSLVRIERDRLVSHNAHVPVLVPAVSSVVQAPFPVVAHSPWPKPVRVFDMWDPFVSAPELTLRMSYLLESPVSKVAVAGDVIAAGSDDGVVTVLSCDADAQAQLRVETRLAGHTSFVAGLCPFGDGWLSSSGSGEVIYHNPTIQWRRRLHSACVWSLDVEGSYLVTGSQDGLCRIFDLCVLKSRLILRGHSDSVNVALWGGNGNCVATGSGDKSVCLYDVRAHRDPQKTFTHTHSVNALCWVSTHTFASGDMDGLIQIFDTRADKPTTAISMGTGNCVNAVSATPFGLAVACGDGNLYSIANQPVHLQQTAIVSPNGETLDCKWHNGTIVASDTESRVSVFTGNLV